MSNLLCNDLSQNYPNQLADYPGKGLWLWFWGALDPFSIEAVLNQLTKRLNYNEGWKCAGNTNFFPNCYREADVEKVLIGYAQLVEKGQINEFTDQNPNSYIVIKAVSDALDVPYVRVQKILLGLYYGTKDGTLKGGQVILKPKTNSKKTGLEEIPQVIKDESLLQRLKDGTLETADTLGKVIKYGTIALGVGAIIYVANMVRPFLPKGK